MKSRGGRRSDSRDQPSEGIAQVGAEGQETTISRVAARNTSDRKPDGGFGFQVVKYRLVPLPAEVGRSDRGGSQLRQPDQLRPCPGSEVSLRRGQP